MTEAMSNDSLARLLERMWPEPAAVPRPLRMEVLHEAARRLRCPVNPEWHSPDEHEAHEGERQEGDL
jgi:hypothetical protein